LIIIATPTRDSVQATFAYDLAQLIKHSPEAEFMVALGTWIQNNRTNLVRESLKMGASHILFIDSDMRFPKDTLERLLKHDKDIIGANCRQRTKDEWTATIDQKFISSTDRTGLQIVNTLGFGVTLIKKIVFKDIPEPWFQMPYDTKEKKFVGEDSYFSVVAGEQSFDIWIDHDLSQEVRHTGSVEF